MRSKLVEHDVVECVLGLGPNLFYNSPMEACVVVCRARKAPERRGRVLFVDAVGEVARERAQSFLIPVHQERILGSYQAFADEPGFAAVATLAEIAGRDHNLSIPLYVRRATASDGAAETRSLREAWDAWEQDGREFWKRMDEVVLMLDETVAGEGGNE